MKPRILFTYASLVFTALLAPAFSKDPATIPTAGNRGSLEPCGNSNYSNPGKCGPCEKGGSEAGIQPNASVGSSCDTNSIMSYNGNAHRSITDLEIAGSVGNKPLAFTRYSNTRLSTRNLAQSAFGHESSWSHSYEWVMRDYGGTVDQPILKVTYPDGTEIQFRREGAQSTTWKPLGMDRSDHLVSSGDDFTLITGGRERYAFKRRYHSITGAVFYRIESITDSVSNTYTVSYYDDNGVNNDGTLISQVTDPAGHWIKLHYSDVSARVNSSTQLAYAKLPRTDSGVWKELTVTNSEAFRYVALYQGNSWRDTGKLKVADVEFYDENNNLITGTPFGSSPWSGTNDPSKAFDGNPLTFYQHEYYKAGHVGLDLGAGNTTQVSRVRYLITGNIGVDDDVSFIGMNNEPVETYVLSSVEGSDGRIIGYTYNVYTESSGLFDWIQLTAANYPDLAESQYTYEAQFDYTMPVLKTADDPRYDDKVKRVRYGYNLNTVVGFVVEEYDDASNKLLVSVNWDDAHTPKLVYPNGKVNRFEYSNGRLMRSVDSFGGATDYTYGSGFLVSSNDPLGRITTYTRDSAGRPLTMTTPGGSVTTYTRDTAGYLTSVNDNGKVTTYTLDPVTKRRTRADYADGTYETWTYNSYGQRLTHRMRNATTQSWTYNAQGLLTQHIDEAGMETTYTYNALNRLATETRHLNATTAYTTSYEYNDRGQITKMTHPDGNFVENVYDDYGNRVATMDESGYVTYYTYDSLSRLITETDPKGNVTAYDYTSSVGGGCGCNTGGLPITITYPDGSVTLNTYDKEWRLTSTTVAFGSPEAATTSYTYDIAGQRTSVTDPLGRVTTYTYDADGRVISETQAAGTPVALTSTSTYAVDGNLVSTTQAVGTPVAVTTTMSYDNMNRVISTTVAAGTPIAATSTRTYNALGQLESTTDPLGRTTNYSYDSAGRQYRTVLPDGTIMESVFDTLGRTVQSIAALGLTEQAVSSATYDSRDRAVTQTDPTGITTTMTYDPRSLLLSVTSPTGKSVSYTYDANGNRTHTTIAPGTPEEVTTIVNYDSRNRPFQTIDGAGSTTTTTYDKQGRPVTVTDALNHTTSYTYDLLGNLLTVTAPDGLVTSTRTYDALNRTLTDRDGKNQTISYQYDALGRQTAYTDAKGATFSFQYDLLGRLTRRTEPDGTFQTYTHDLAGRLLVHTKADGQTKTHHYAPQRDFLTEITYSNGESPREMSYDRLGRLRTAANAHAAITRTYDAAGRQLTETQLLTDGKVGTFQYEYDEQDGNLSRHIRPDGSIVDYAWNARNLLSAVTSDGPPPVATYTYNARNQIASTVVENGIFTASRTYDAAGRLTALTNGAINSTGYTLSPDGRRTAVSRDGNVENYGYDNARQVTSANYGGLSTTQSWAYDAAGNRDTATTNGVTTDYTANSVNEYTFISGLPTNPTYDDNGNATTWNIRPGGLLSSSLRSSAFFWDINNQLVAAVDNNTGDSAAYQYDALGRRVKSISIINNQQSTIYYLYNGWNVELERNDTNYTKRMTWGLDLSQSLQGAGGVGGLVMVEDLTGGTATASFPTYDGNGNITAWVNASGSVIATQRYDAFGNIIQQTGTAPSNYGFSTKPMDQVTGLLYYGYRYYDPVTGRWPSRDPIEESGGVNLYGFVGNDGVNAWDLRGLHSYAYLGALPAKDGVNLEMDPKWSCKDDGTIYLDSFDIGFSGPIIGGVLPATFANGKSAWASVYAKWQFLRDTDVIWTRSAQVGMGAGLIGGAIGAITGPGFLIVGGASAFVGGIFGAIGGLIEYWEGREWSATMMIKQKAECVPCSSGGWYVEYAPTEFYPSTWDADPAMSTVGPWKEYPAYK